MSASASAASCAVAAVLGAVCAMALNPQPGFFACHCRATSVQLRGASSVRQSDSSSGATDPLEPLDVLEGGPGGNEGGSEGGSEKGGDSDGVGAPASLGSESPAVSW